MNPSVVDNRNAEDDDDGDWFDMDPDELADGLRARLDKADDDGDAELDAPPLSRMPMMLPYNDGIYKFLFLFLQNLMKKK